MKKRFIVIFFMFILCVSISAQTSKISRIIDSNLFGLADGRMIKLAGLDVPNKNHPDRYLRSVADKALVYARSVFLNRYFTIHTVTPPDSTRDYELVIIQKDYPLGLIDYNKEYLSQGFGRFTGQAPKDYYNDYRNAEQDALVNERGIWKVINAGSAETFDRDFSAEEQSRYVQKDSIFSLRTEPVEYRRNPSPGIIAGEVCLAPVMGILTAIPTTFLFAGLSDANQKNDRFDNGAFGILGAGLGYIAGTGIGVYILAHADNPNVTFTGTLTGAALGAVGGIGLAALMNNGKSSAPYIVGFAGPLIGSMVYTNFLVSRPLPKTYNPSNQGVGLSYSHKDLYNSTVLYNMNLFTIAF